MNAIHFFDWGDNKKNPYKDFILAASTEGVAKLKGADNINGAYKDFIGFKINKNEIIFNFKKKPSEVIKAFGQIGDLLEYTPNQLKVFLNMKSTPITIKSFEKDIVGIYVNGEKCNIIKKEIPYGSSSSIYITFSGCKKIIADDTDILDIKIIVNT